MHAALLGLLFAGSGVGIHLDRYAGLELESATHFVDALARHIERQTGVRPVLDDPLWPACQSEDRCLPQIRDRTRADELVLVLILGAPTKLRLIAERWPTVEKIEIDVPRDESSWSEVLAGAARALFPDAATLREKQLRISEPPASTLQKSAPAKESRWPAYLALGGGAAAAGVGIALEVVSLNARSRIESPPELSPSEYDSELFRMRAAGVAGYVLLGVAAACLAGAVWMISD